MKKGQILCLFILFFVCNAEAQTYEEFQKKQQEQINAFENKQKNKIDSTNKQYTQYLSKRDKDWTNYLRTEWEKFQVFSGNKLPEKPKPKVVPICNIPVQSIPSKIPEIPTIIPQIIDKPQDIPQSKPIVELPSIQPINTPNNLNSTITYYGRDINIPFDKELAALACGNVDKNEISNYWEKVSTTNYQPTFNSLLKVKNDIHLCDYAFLDMVRQFSTIFYQNDLNTAYLFTWFVMVQAGYNVKVGYQDTKIILLIPSYQKLYNNSYTTIGNTQYYMYPASPGGSFYTYEKNYSSDLKLLNMNIENKINFAGRKAERRLNFNFENKTYSIQTLYDPDYIAFLKNYPVSDLRVYFDGATSNYFQQSLVSKLKAYTQGMDEVKAVNFMLHFVQTAFEYKTDDEQFGREKYFFADELMFYPFSDCEDRSVLFARLVKEVIGLNVVGLEYANHVAAAVAFSSPTNGDYLVFKNNRYVISDPTYINASAGMTMPQYKTASPKVIEIAK